MADPWDEFNDAHPATAAWSRLQSLGVEATSGFRTEGDVKRLKAEGYTPATNGAHNRGDGIDLTPGKSGLSLSQLRTKAQSEFGKGAHVSIDNGTHVHVAVPGWGTAPDLYRADPWDAFKDARPAKPSGGASAAAAPRSGLRLSGQVHDGDTFELAAGGNARLFGVDAYELRQQGRERDGSLVNLGDLGRDYMAGRLSPDTPVSAGRRSTYGRPVVRLGNTDDPALGLLHEGYGLAAPEYLKGSPEFSPYIEAERQARMNLLGGHGTNAETPGQFRHKDGPWQGNEPGQWGQGQAVFPDERMPFAGMRPEFEQAYRDAALAAKTPQELVAAAQAVGATLPLDMARDWLAQRDKALKAGAGVDEGVNYIEPPRPVIDPGDGTFGSWARGFGDPFNLIDELGGVADTLGGTGGRENVWNSDRRFGDILWNNIDQNRDILAHDDDAHPIARIGGQLTSGVLLPGFAAKGATLGQFARIGAIEGGLAGFGAGEGDLTQRLPNTALGVAAGTAGGAVLHQVGERVLSPMAKFVMGKMRRGEPVNENIMREVADEIGLVANDGAQNAGPTPAATSQPRGGVAAMRDESQGPELVGPRIAEGPDVYAEFPDAPFNVARNVNERLAPGEMAKLAEDVDPASVLPRPDSSVQDLDEAVKANPGRFAELEAPDPFDSLGVRRIGNGTRVRGPLDITQALRTYGGLRDDGGELRHLGLSNAPRRMDFGSNEQFLGRLVSDDGMSLDDATMRLWEDGYFPEFRDRPTPNDLLDRLRDESLGTKRYFASEDLNEVDEFHAAQSDVARIEAARSDGSPLVEERGHSINLDDLDANRPPALAYEDTPRLTGKIGNINLDRLENPGEVAQLIDQISKRVAGSPLQLGARLLRKKRGSSQPSWAFGLNSCSGGNGDRRLMPSSFMPQGR